MNQNAILEDCLWDRILLVRRVAVKAGMALI